MSADQELAAFFAARLDEGEANAPNLHDVISDKWCEGSCICDYPARALREVAAGRAIIERYKHAAAAPPPNANFTAGQDDGYRQACADAIRDLAAVWSDHPDYRQEWKP